MQKLLKLGLFVAAGYGTYEILRRAGLLAKAGQWLQDNVPEDVQAKVRDHVQQAKDQASTLKGQAGEKYASLKGQAQEQFDSLKAKATDKYGSVAEQVQQGSKKLGEQYDHAKEVVTSKVNGLRGGSMQQPTSNNEGMQPPVAEEGDSVHTTDAAPAPSGQTITGPGRGTDDATSEVNGGTVHHRVGRGVVHG